MPNTPDTIFPSDNDLGIPTLSLGVQGDFIDLPCYPWGSQRRRKRSLAVGTWHFYVDDYKFSALWNNPELVVDSGCITLIEPNYSIGQYTTKAQAIWLTYQKRWLARYWQSKNIKIFVDIFVGDRLRDINFLGVPREWKAYATRYQSLNFAGQTEGAAALMDDYKAAIAHHGSSDIIFAVYGGKKPIERLCAAHGWLWIPDFNFAVRNKA